MPGSETAIHLENLLERAAPDPAHWSVNKSLTALTIHTSEPALISFGTHQDEPTEFELTLRQEQWVGLFDMFFGHQWMPSEPRMQYQGIVLLKKLDGSLLLRGNTYDYDPADPTGVHVSNHIVEWKIERLPPHGCALRFQIDGQLSKVWFNSSDLGSDFVTQWQQSLRGSFAQGRGQFGALAMHGPGSFHNAILNQKNVLIRQ